MILALMLGNFCAAFLLAWGLNWFALIPWRRSTGKHWTERAHLLYPAQKSARLNNWLIPVNLSLLSFNFFPDFNFFFAAISGFAGALLAGYFMSREVFPDLKFKLWLHLVVAGLFLFFVWWVVLIVTVLEMPENFSPLTWLVAGGVLILFLAFNFGLGLHLLKWFRLLQPASERLKSLVAEVSQKMGVPIRASWILSTHVSNALAFPLTRQLVFTEKLLSTLSDEETKAICAHELGHLNEPRKVLFVRVLVSLAVFPIIFARPLGSLGNSRVNAYWMLLIEVLILWLLGIRLSRRMEKRADKIAAENQVDAAVYARALERLYETNQAPAVMPRRSNKIHPDLYDRMIAAGVTPDFTKPKPPKSLCWSSWVLWFCFVIILVFPFFLETAKGLFVFFQPPTIVVK
jgi:Zn-dependent protease with chaperone function